KGEEEGVQPGDGDGGGNTYAHQQIAPRPHRPAREHPRIENGHETHAQTDHRRYQADRDEIDTIRLEPERGDVVSVLRGGDKLRDGARYSHHEEDNGPESADA